MVRRHASCFRSIFTVVLLSSIGLTSDLGLAQIEEVIVTAQKRDESIQDVPIAMTAFDTSALEAR